MLYKNFKMKKILLSFLIITGIAISSDAQIRRNSSDKSESKTEENSSMRHKKSDRKKAHHEMMKNLNLDKNQKQQMKSLNKDFKSRMADLKNSNMSADELKTKKKAIFLERKQKMESLLTPEQKIKMQQFHKEMHENRKVKES